MTVFWRMSGRGITKRTLRESSWLRRKREQGLRGKKNGITTNKMNFKKGDFISHTSGTKGFYIKNGLIERIDIGGGWVRDRNIPKDYVPLASNTYWFIDKDGWSLGTPPGGAPTVATVKPTPKKQQKIKVGNRVEFAITPGNQIPDFGSEGSVTKNLESFIKHGFRDIKGNSGIIRAFDDEWVMVEYESPAPDSRTMCLGFTYDKLKIGKGKAKKESHAIDLKKLDALVVKPEVRDEIEAVLKQHNHSDTIFDKWGLGDVIEYGRGMTFLFYGPPGTGKTWAANCISKSLGQELLTIGAAEIQTSEPGGANRNIQDAFKAAKKDNKILFIDECDSLITNRNDVGMILGGEINTLLTEIEKCLGVVILATNRIENLDEALERRISLIVEFPEPDYEAREAIWGKFLPKKMPREDTVTPSSLAEHKLTGGQIKNVVLQAARLALAGKHKKVMEAHFTSAIERVQNSKSLMGTSSRYHQIRVREDMQRG